MSVIDLQARRITRKYKCLADEFECGAAPGLPPALMAELDRKDMAEIFREIAALCDEVEATKR
jgi:hypothetical protein